MTERSVDHGTFSIARSYDVSPARVFAAWADLAIKSHWFSEPGEWVSGTHELDFRVGGREVSRGGPDDGPVHTYVAIYWDIVPNERIVYTYEMLLNGTRNSVSLATIELKPDGEGTRLMLTEQGVFLDGHDSPARREQGMGSLLDALGRALRDG